MNTDQATVSIYLHESGQLKAFADFTVQTPYGEMTLKGCRVIQKPGKDPWVAVPTVSYVKAGQKKYKEVIETSQTTRRKLAEAILAAYHNALEASK